MLIFDFSHTGPSFKIIGDVYLIAFYTHLHMCPLFSTHEYFIDFLVETHLCQSVCEVVCFSDKGNYSALFFLLPCSDAINRLPASASPFSVFECTEQLQRARVHIKLELGVVSHL